jgi:hypothetical protein
VNEDRPSPTAPQAAPDTWPASIERELQRLVGEVERLNHEHIKVASQVAQLMRERAAALAAKSRGR